MGRLEQTLYDDTVTPAISRGYDDNGNVLSVNRGGVNWTYTYNELDLVETESLVIDALPPYLINPEYDGNERLAQKTYPSGSVYTFDPDGHGRSQEIRLLGSTQYVSNVTYYPNGKIDTLSRGNGGTFDQNLNARQLVSNIAGNWGDSFTYTHDANGRIDSITAAISSAYNRQFDYDGVGRLKVANAYGTNGWGAGTYSYDKLGNLELKTLGGRTVNPVYNTTTNRLTSVDDTAEVGGPRSYIHDNRGNVTSDGNHTFTYDLENQPISISGADSGTYRYDGNLKRVKQDVNGETIYSVYDSTGAILTRINTSTGETTDYLTVAGQTFVRVTNGTPSYPLNDHLGTSFMVADQSGNILPGQTYNYTPFGETWPYGGNDPGDDNEQGYTGHIEDETGLTYMQARFYDPVIGRFLQTDPIGYEDQLNLYAYVANDPINNVDPTGTTCTVNDDGVADCVVDDPGNMSAKEIKHVEKAYTKAVNKLLKDPSAKEEVTVDGESFTVEAGQLADTLINAKVIGAPDDSSARASTSGGTFDKLEGKATASGGVEITIHENAINRTLMQARRNDRSLSETFIHESMHNSPDEARLYNQVRANGRGKFNEKHRARYNDAAHSLF